MAMKSFKAKIQIIGINPYVVPPVSVLKKFFRKRAKRRGQSVKGTITPFIYSTLVRYSGSRGYTSILP
jgi:hypothetical protein